jgi:hypothetical protein
LPKTRTVNRRSINAEQIAQIIDTMEEPHDLCLKNRAALRVGADQAAVSLGFGLK